MKIPLSPPTLGDLLSRVGPDRLGVILPVDRSDLVDGRYLHWDDLRHRAPPEGLTIEEWWLGVKLARLGRATTVPLLRDKGDRPFTFGMPERVQRELHRIDRDAAGQIGMATPVAGAADRDRYLLKSLVEEAITSSQLEGAATTRRVAEAMLREGRSPRDRGEHMIFNNFAAMQRIRDICREPLSPRIVLDLHRTLTANTLDDPTDAGRLRESDDVRVVDHRDGTVLHEPPAPGELPERI
ncbi:MAG: Fic family protein, partial [Thiotrichales bacterium]